MYFATERVGPGKADEDAREGGRTDASYEEREAEPHLRAKHLPAMEACSDKKEYSEDDGGWLVRDVMPEVEASQIRL